jgi:hypothetical protein
MSNILKDIEEYMRLKPGCLCGCGTHCGHSCLTDDCDCNECLCYDCKKESKQEQEKGQ